MYSTMLIIIAALLLVILKLLFERSRLKKDIYLYKERQNLYKIEFKILRNELLNYADKEEEKDAQ
jgi:hypothetical protein